MSQPAVSFQIRALEERLGHRLLDRSGRRVRLTEAGEVVYRYARRMIGLEAELEREMGEIGTRVSGRLVLGRPPGRGRCCCRGCSGRSTRRTRTCKVSLVVSDTQTVCERVLDDELELGVVGAARPHRGLVFEPFVRDELVAIVPPGHPLAERGSVSLEELAAEPMLIQQEGSGVRSVVEAALRESGVRDRDLKVAMELGLQQSVKAAVLDGFGITVISRLAVERELADGEPGGPRARGSRAGAALLRRAARRADPQAGHPGVRRVRPRGARRHGRARIGLITIPYHAGSAGSVGSPRVEPLRRTLRRARGGIGRRRHVGGRQRGGRRRIGDRDDQVGPRGRQHRARPGRDPGRDGRRRLARVALRGHLRRRPPCRAARARAPARRAGARRHRVARASSA